MTKNTAEIILSDQTTLKELRNIDRQDRYWPFLVERKWRTTSTEMCEIQYQYTVNNRFLTVTFYDVNYMLEKVLPEEVPDPDLVKPYKMHDFETWSEWRILQRVYEVRKFRYPKELHYLYREVNPDCVKCLGGGFSVEDDRMVICPICQ